MRWLAVPGYTIEDCGGTRYFEYGYEIEMPSADLLTPDGKRLILNRNGRIYSLDLAAGKIVLRLDDRGDAVARNSGARLANGA